MATSVLQCLLCNAVQAPWLPVGKRGLLAYQEHVLCVHGVSEEDLLWAQVSTHTTDLSEISVWTLPDGRPWLRAERLQSLFKAVLVAGYPQETLAATVDVSLDILAKLYARVIHGTSIPTLLLDHLAAVLKVSRDLIEAELDGPPRDPSLLGGSAGSQQPWGKESFRQAVRESPLLSRPQKAVWLARVDAEGKGARNRQGGNTNIARL